MHRNTLLSLRTAAMINGGLKDACDTQVTVAAPYRLLHRDVSTYTPFDSIRSVFCLTFASIVFTQVAPHALRKPLPGFLFRAGTIAPRRAPCAPRQAGRISGGRTAARRFGGIAAAGRRNGSRGALWSGSTGCAQRPRY